MAKTERRASGIYARAGKLYAVITVSEIEDGKRVSKNKWVSTGFEDRPRNIKLAKDFREDLLIQKDGGFKVGTRVTVEKFTKHYLEMKRRLVADTTYCSVEYKARHIADYFKNVDITTITTDDINKFLDYLLVQGNYSAGKNRQKGLGKRTVKDIKDILGSIMSQAQAEGIIRKNPALDATMNAQLVRKLNIVDEEDTFFDYEEVCEFLKIAKEDPLFEFFYFTVFFGLRRAEALGLRWSNIDLDKRKLTIASTVTKGTTIHRENAVKTDSSLRTYPLSEEQVTLLKRLREQEDENRRLFGRSYFDSDYVFKHPDGMLYYPDHPSDKFKKILNRNPQLPQHVTLHGLRASCISILVHEGLDVKQIQKWVGHKDMETTLKIYSKVKSTQSKEEISKKMSSLIRIEQ